MKKGNNNSRGFTLIAALLIVILLSAVSCGLLYLVNNESQMSGNDQENNLAYYEAESGMEKLTSDLAALYQTDMVPTQAQITNLTTSTYYPTAAMVGNGITYAEQISFPTVGTSAGICTTLTPPVATDPPSCFGTITTGGNTGLYAELTPLELQVSATRISGAYASISREVDVAEIPVFQFGVFCGYDCSYFAGPDFTFAGRVHTNMNLFLASQDHLMFGDKVQAFKQIITDRLENGFSTATYNSPVYVPDAAGGCPLATVPPTASTCIQLSTAVPGDESWSGGYPPTGSANATFPSLSKGTFNYYLANSLTGVTNLQLPFVQNSCVSNPPPCTDPITIVRKPLAGESPTGVIGSERLYNKAQIRILLADDPADLHPDRGTAPLGDGGDIQFPNVTTWTTAPFSTNAAVTVSAGGATATESVGFATNGTSGWVTPRNNSGAAGTWTTWPLMEAFSITGAVPTAVTGSWIRVEWCSAATTCTPVTKEWLNLGFGQLFDTPPTTAGGNTVNTNAILILQQLQPGIAATSANLSNVWWPINFYDAREGEMRDNNVANTTDTPTATGAPLKGDNLSFSSCSVNGIMNAVELDVGNLGRWLKGTIGSTGTSVPYASENGYILYFSDHRGMRLDPNPSNGGNTPAGVYSGESGIEDVINSAQPLTSTTTDGVLETKTYYSYSPEDVDQNNVLDNWGEVNLGYGFGINTNTSPPDPYTNRVGVTVGATTTGQGYTDCAAVDTSAAGTAVYTNMMGAGHTTDQEGLANAVSGARHVLMLVDGGMGTGVVSPLPIMPAASGCSQTAANPTGCGGFTLASENPVYVLGDYNSGKNDLFWGSPTATPPPQSNHSAASIIADSVMLLSDQWSNANSLVYPTAPGSRATSTDAWYRMAISGGKNVPFPQPGWTGVGTDFGTDGGMHNFLRYLENWGNTLHYNGSLVSMYYSEYDTGTFKCCTVVYSPPTRDYYFDVLFLNPADLPPGTPMLEDIVSMSYRQNFTPQ